MDFEEDEFDKELQEAFAAGRLKPGLNIPTVEKVWKNNVVALEKKLEDIKLKRPWVERLDIITAPAPMAPEMFHEISEKEKNSVVRLKTHIRAGLAEASEASLVLDDFKREMLFHRQAQAAVLEGIKRLNDLGVPTLRPDDYFAEMAKSDDHMHKVRESLAARQKGAQRAERVSQLRHQRQISKKTAVEAKLNQAKEKKKMLTEVQKFRKGIRKDLDFLDGKDKPAKNTQKKGSGKSPRSVERKKYKDSKFGFGGKKRGSKRNTRESAADERPGFKGRGNAPKGGKGGRGAAPRAKGRPGKSKRISARNRK